MKFTRLNAIIWLLVLGSINLVSGQTFSEQFKSIAQEKDGYSIQIGLDSLLNTVLDDETYAKMSHAFSVSFYKRSDYEAASKYGLLEVRRLEEANIIDESYVRALFQLGFFYELTSQFNEAIDCYNKVISTAPNSKKAVESYGTLGECYESLGNYYQAETFFLKAIAESEKHNDLGLLASQLLKLANIYRDFNTDKWHKKELETLNKVLEIHKIEPLSKRRLSVLLNSLANHYNNHKTYDFEKAKYYYNQLVVTSQLDSDLEVTGSAYGNLGNLYLKEKNDSALYYLKKSLSYPLKRTDQALVYRNLKGYELKFGTKENAIAYLDKAILFNFSNQDIDLKNPNLTDYKKAQDLAGVIATLSQKAEILLEINDEKNDPSLVVDAFKNLQTADSLIDYLKFSNREENARLYWRKEASKVYHNAVYCSYLLKNPELAFTYSEKNKAILLTENIIQNSFELPVALKKRKKFLSLQLDKYERELKKTKDSSSIKFYSNSIVNQKLAIKKYDDSIRKLYPSLTERINQLEILSLAEVQKNLKEDEVLISYVWNENVDLKDHLMCIVLQPSSVDIIEVEKATELNEELNKYLNSLRQPFKTSTDKNLYAQTAHKIYDRLFTDHNLSNVIKNKKVTIIADGSLQKIPFDALITNIDQHKYLIEDCQVTYTYSMSFSKSNRAIERNAEKNLIAFAPVHFNKLELPELYNTLQEVKAIDQNIEGDLYTDSLARKETFLRQIGNYKIIHLATHASAGEDPYLAFYDERLNIKELYASTNKADLVFLSACETTTGEIVQGEGALTLARGFFNTGAQSVIATLWKTSDKSSSYIVSEFYKNIDDGVTVSNSLHLAKLKYIKEHQLSDSSPFYWSSLIVLGEDQKIPLDNNNFFIFLTVIGLCLIVFAGLLWRLKFSNRAS